MLSRFAASVAVSLFAGGAGVWADCVFGGFAAGAGVAAPCCAPANADIIVATTAMAATPTMATHFLIPVISDP